MWEKFLIIIATGIATSVLNFLEFLYLKTFIHLFERMMRETETERQRNKVKEATIFHLLFHYPICFNR